MSKIFVDSEDYPVFRELVYFSIFIIFFKTHLVFLIMRCDLVDFIDYLAGCFHIVFKFARSIAITIDGVFA